MNLEVDQHLCCGHGRCATEAGELFKLDGDGFAQLRGRGPVPVPEALGEVALRGRDSCPEGAIALHDISETSHAHRPHA